MCGIAEDNKYVAVFKNTSLFLRLDYRRVVGSNPIWNSDSSESTIFLEFI